MVQIYIMKGKNTEKLENWGHFILNPPHRHLELSFKPVLWITKPSKPLPL